MEQNPMNRAWALFLSFGNVSDERTCNLDDSRRFVWECTYLNSLKFLPVPTVGHGMPRKVANVMCANPLV